MFYSFRSIKVILSNMEAAITGFYFQKTNPVRQICCSREGSNGGEKPSFRSSLIPNQNQPESMPVFFYHRPVKIIFFKNLG